MAEGAEQVAAAWRAHRPEGTGPSDSSGLSVDYRGETRSRLFGFTRILVEMLAVLHQDDKLGDQKGS